MLHRRLAEEVASHEEQIAEQLREVEDGKKVFQRKEVGARLSLCLCA